MNHFLFLVITLLCFNVGFGQILLAEYDRANNTGCVSTPTWTATDIPTSSFNDNNKYENSIKNSTFEVY